MMRRWAGTALVGALIVGSGTSAQAASTDQYRRVDSAKGVAAEAVRLAGLKLGFGPGAPSIGDRYFPLDGNTGYDVGNYDLDVRYDPPSDALQGTATITATSTQFLTSFFLDLDGLTVSDVGVNGTSAWFRQIGTELLVVVPRTPVRKGAEFTTVVTYSGVPQAVQDERGTSGFVATADGALAAGWPHVAATWFPANDHPRDAATVQVTATVPEGLAAVSNGLPGPAVTADGWTTQTWAAAEPVAPYQVLLAVGDFSVRTWEEDGITFVDALEKDLEDKPSRIEQETPTTFADNARAAMDRQPEIIRYFAGFFGDYPFTTAGGVVAGDDWNDSDWGNQTRPLYSPGNFSWSSFNEWVLAENTARQWFGADLRPARWRDAWLTEGFVQYASYLYTTQAWGWGPGSWMYYDVDDILAYDPMWKVRIGDPGPDEVAGQAVSIRGGLTIAALQNEVGDDVFWQIVRAWTSENSGRAVTTEDFIALSERISGRDLGEFFDTWLYTPEKPAVLPDDDLD